MLKNMGKKIFIILRYKIFVYPNLAALETQEGVFNSH